MAESDLIRGNIDTVILKILYEGDRYGYDMIKIINARSGGQWEIKQPTLYACLKRLEKKGFITSYWEESTEGGRRKYYSLTETGKEVFVSYKNDWERTRDLFGGLINEDDPILPVDDFSDVEDETYSVPKRRPVKRERKKESKPEAPQEQTADALVTEEASETKALPDAENTDTANIEYTQTPENFPVYTVDKSEQPDEPESVSSPEQIEEEAEQEVAEPEKAIDQVDDKTDESEALENIDEIREYVQDSFFDMRVVEDEKRVEEYAENTEDEKREQSEATETVEAADPRAIIDEMFASHTSTNESYFSARAKYYPEEYEDEPVAPPPPIPPAPPAPPAPPVAPPTPPVPVQSSTQLVPTETIMPAVRESAASIEYKEILRSMVENSESITRYNEEREQAAASNEADKRFEEVAQTITELGNEVNVRTHNDSAKVYTHKYYYYSNRLLLNHYAAMCAVMFLLGLTLFLTFYVGLGMRMKYDYLLYTFAGLLPIIMFIVTVIMFAADPDKKKRINVNFRFSFIIRAIIMLQVAVIIYCLNLIWGMPVSFSAAYIPSLILPLAYAIFIPISELIFMVLLKSDKYAVE